MDATNTATDYVDLAREVGALVSSKNKAYGDSHALAASFFQLLYPNGIRPDQYADALTLVRMFDKMKRIATDPGAFGEDPYADLVGYALLGLRRVRATTVRMVMPSEDLERLARHHELSRR